MSEASMPNYAKMPEHEMLGYCGTNSAMSGRGETPMPEPPLIWAWPAGVGSQAGWSYRKEHAGGAAGMPSTPYFRRDAVRQVMVDVCAGSVPQETIDLCRAQGVDPHDALQMGWAAACFKLKALLDALDEDAAPAPTNGPTPEAGYQSLLRETAGERLGATK